MIFPNVNVMKAFIKFELEVFNCHQKLVPKAKVKIKGKMDLPNKPSCKYFCEQLTVGLLTNTMNALQSKSKVWTPDNVKHLKIQHKTNSKFANFYHYIFYEYFYHGLFYEGLNLFVSDELGSFLGIDCFPKNTPKIHLVDFDTPSKCEHMRKLHTRFFF